MTWEEEAGMRGRKRVSKEGEETKKMMELDLDFAQTSAVIVNMVILIIIIIIIVLYKGNLADRKSVPYNIKTAE